VLNYNYVPVQGVQGELGWFTATKRNRFVTLYIVLYVRASVAKIDPLLSLWKCHFYYRFFAPEHDCIGILTNKIQDDGDIWVGQKFFFSNSRIRFKTLSRFVVPSSTKILQKNVFENLSKWRDNPRWWIFYFFFKNLAKISEQRFFYSLDGVLFKNIHVFWKKWLQKKIRMSPKN
jgi:hypothetical protein